MKRRLIIHEDQLSGWNSHHASYVRAITHAADRLGVSCVILGNINMSADIVRSLNAKPCLLSLTSRKGDSSLKSVAGLFYKLPVLRAIWQNWWVLRKHLGTSPQATNVFFPTAWIPQIILCLLLFVVPGPQPARCTLLFVRYPQPHETKSFIHRTIKVLLHLVCKIAPSVKIAVETSSAQKTWQKLLRRRVFLLTHPIQPISVVKNQSPHKLPVFGSYGLARHEQGIDILMAALTLLHQSREIPGYFHVLWPQPFQMPDGSWLSPNQFTHLEPHVRFISQPVDTTAYTQLLLKTDWLVLPYRPSSYKQRCSRISLEACTAGIPIIYTKDTHLEEVVRLYGSGLGVAPECPNALAEAIVNAARRTSFFQNLAQKRMVVAQREFSAFKLLQQLDCIASEPES